MYPSGRMVLLQTVAREKRTVEKSGQDEIEDDYRQQGIAEHGPKIERPPRPGYDSHRCARCVMV